MAIYGFIGTGNMGSAMARAARRALSGQEVLLANRTPAKAEALARELDCRVGSNADVAQEADYIFLGVKPQMMAEMLAGIAPVLAQRKSRFILVSLAAGLTMSRLQELAGGNYPVMRILPNTPAAIGAGMVFYTMGPDISDAEAHDFLDTMSGAGRFAPLPEHLIDAGSSVAGCGPAFAAMFLEALADGGVACGLSRADARTFAAQMMLGTAQLALTSNQHTSALKDAVCSPGGSTIQGVRVLEEAGFRGAVMDAVIAAWEKSADLGK